MKPLWKKNSPHWRSLYDTVTILVTVQDNRPENRLKRLIFTSKWTTAWHHNVRDTSVNRFLESFDAPINVEEELETGKKFHTIFSVHSLLLQRLKQC